MFEDRIITFIFAMSVKADISPTEETKHFRKLMATKNFELLQAEWRRDGYRVIKTYVDPIVHMIASYGDGKVPAGIGIVYRTFILSNYPMEKRNIYALYRGNELLSLGTLEEIAEDMNVSVKTILHYGTPTWRNRKGFNWETARVLIKVEDDDDI